MMSSFRSIQLLTLTRKPLFIELPAGHIRCTYLCAVQSLKEEKKMLWTIFVILLVLWLVGLVSSYTMGGFIHLLLVLALIVLVLNLVTGRRAV
jgi:Family of unknown function (DUF5670)